MPSGFWRSKLFLSLSLSLSILHSVHYHTKNGRRIFKFKPNLHEKSKTLCKNGVFGAIDDGVPIVIMDNANPQKW